MGNTESHDLSSVDPDETRPPGAAALLLPGATSPQLLTRILEAVARGVRTTRGLQESAGVGVQTVRAYVHAGAWLGLVAETDPVQLSPLGLEYVYAGSRRPAVYARAVWSNPLAAELLVASDGRLPDSAAIERVIVRSEPGLAEATVRRRANAVRGLVQPAVGQPRPQVGEEEEQRQLGLPLEHATGVAPATAVGRGLGEHDPDLYRYVLACLLDHGELSVGHLRALLDRAGASASGLGGIMERFALRGDAARLDERFVATSGAVARRDLVATTAGVILSDPGYRTWLATPERRLVRDAARWRVWDRRLFGRSVGPEEVAQALEGMVVDRPPSAFPVAGPIEEPLFVEGGAFLDQWEREGLRIALPPALGQLLGGPGAVNRMLIAARQGAGVTLPDAADRPAVVHMGLIHPGEALPRSVPDVRTLRQRLLMHAPYPAIVTALLLLHRLASDRVSVCDEGEGWTVRRGDGQAAPLLAWVDGFAASRGWVALRREGAGATARTLVALLEAVGIASAVGRGVVLSEALFAQLQSEAEESEIHARLQPLADAAEAWLSA